MEIFLNGEPVDFEANEEETVGDVLTALRGWLRSEGRIKAFLLDGKSVETVETALTGQPYRTVKRIELEWEPNSWIVEIAGHPEPQTLLKEILTALAAREEALKNFAIDLQMNGARSAYEAAADYVENLQKLIVTLLRIKEAGILPPDAVIGGELPVDAYLDVLRERLGKLSRALSDEDVILSGDLFEYEIIPLIQALKDFQTGESDSL